MRFHLAKQLHQRGVLESLYTAVPRSRIAGIPPKKIRSNLLLAGWIKAQRGLGVQSVRVDQWTKAWYDNWCMTKAGDEDVLIAVSGSATKTLTNAKGRGVKSVCERGSNHLASQLQIIREEAKRLGLRPPGFDNDPDARDRGLRRELCEYELCDAIVVPSQVSKDSFVQEGVPSNKVHVINLGADLQQFRPLEVESSRDNFAVLSVGQFSYQKGFQFLLPAYRAIRRTGTSLTIAGGLPDPDFFRMMHSDEDDDVHFLGALPRERVAQLMRSSAVFVIASIQDGFAQVVPQAMASGVPVIVSESTGAADIVADGVTGFVVPTGKPDALAEKLSWLLDHPDDARAMGVASRRAIESRGGWNRYGAEYVSFLERLTGS